MIETLLPRQVVAEEAFDDVLATLPLHPGEVELVARAVDKRRREFAVVRACARRAMGRLGYRPQAVLRGEMGAPLFPAGLVGSMTHCDGYRAAVLARAGDLASVGIDGEPHEPVPDGVLEVVSLPEERVRLARSAAEAPHVHWDRLLFCAKEAVYKAWFPLTGRWLDFSEADITLSLDGSGGSGGPGVAGAATGGFRARLLVPGPRVGDRTVEEFHGRWSVGRGLVLAAIAVPPGPSGAC